MFAADSVELDEVGMLQLGHHFGLLDEVILTHRPLLHHFHSDVRRSPPLASSHHSKLAPAQLLSQGQLRRVDLPLSGGQACCGRLRPARRVLQPTGETTRVVGVVFYQLGNRWLTVLLTQEISARVLFDVVVLHLGMRYLCEEGEGVEALG